MNDAKRYLLQLHALDRRISSLQDELERRRSKMTSISIRYDKINIQSSPSADPMAEYAASVDELLGKLAEVQSEYTRKRILIEHQIMDLGEQNRTYAEILGFRYIMYRTWAQIADKLGLTYDTVVKYHGKALRMFQDKYGI